MGRFGGVYLLAGLCRFDEARSAGTAGAQADCKTRTLGRAKSGNLHAVRKTFPRPRPEARRHGRRAQYAPPRTFKTHQPRFRAQFF